VQQAIHSGDPLVRSSPFRSPPSLLLEWSFVDGVCCGRMRAEIRWATLAIALSGSGCASRQLALHARDAQGTTKTTAELLRLIPSVDSASDPLPIPGENASFVG
jgi:hypothetical protein